MKEIKVAEGWKLVTPDTGEESMVEPFMHYTPAGIDWASIYVTFLDDDIEIEYVDNLAGKDRVYVPLIAMRALIEAHDAWKARQ